MSKKRGNSDMKKKLPLIGIVFLSVLVVGGGVLGYIKYDDLRKENQRLSNPAEATKSEVEKTKAQVSAILEVPTDEEPTIANVVDTSKLSDQEFFKSAKNGDKLLVYQKAKKAILYRPETNKIIEVSTISIGEESPTTEPKTEATTPSATDQQSTTPVAPTEQEITTQPGLEP